MATLIPRPFSFIKNQDWASDYVRAAIRDNRDGSLSNRALINASSALFDTVAGRQPTRPEFFARLSQFVMAHPSYAAPAGPLRVQTRAPQRAFLDLESIDLDTGGDDMAAPTLIVPGGLTRLLPDGLMRVATRLPSGDVAVKPQPGMDLSAMEQQVDQINRMLRAQGASLQPVPYTHLRAHETDSYLVRRLLFEKKRHHITSYTVSSINHRPQEIVIA